MPANDFSIINQIYNYFSFQTLVRRTQHCSFSVLQLVVQGTYQLSSFFLTKCFPKKKISYFKDNISIYTSRNYIIFQVINRNQQKTQLGTHTVRESIM